MRIRKALVLPDAHCPFEDSAAIKAVCSYAATQVWDELILLGDWLDLNCISRFNEGFPGRKAGETLLYDVAHAGVVLDSVLAAVRKNNNRCKATLLEGNHEGRIGSYVDKHPELEGLVAVPRLLKLKKRRVNWVPFDTTGEVYRIGDAAFIHGLYTNVYHARKHALAYGCNVYYGHVHDVQEHTEILKGDHSYTAKSLGNLCLKPTWMHGRPDKWQQAFSEFYFLSDGTHQEFTVKIQGGSFISPDGVRYAPSR